MKTSDKGFFASSALFFLLCGFSILNSFSSMSFSKLGTGSISPENLRSAAYNFKLSLAVEDGSKTIGDFDTQSWVELESRLAGYADRLELCERQDRFRNYLISFLHVASTISMIAFSVARKKSQPPGHNKPEISSPITPRVV
jgi:hypothetical protein